MYTTSVRLCAALGACLLAAAAAACGSSETEAAPVAVASVALSHDRAPGGSPLDITYKFVVAADASFSENYRVLVHLVDTDEEQLWTDDHDPPTPTSQWKAGQTVEYTRTVFIPQLPYVGESFLQIGLHKDGQRLPLGGEHAGQRAYRVATLQILPPTENIFTVFKDGWHPQEVAGDNANVSWQWTKKEATLAFKNPRQPVTFYLDVDNPSGVPAEGQQVQVSVGGQTADEFRLTPKERQMRRTTLTAEQLGPGEMSEIQVMVDRTFVPAQSSLSPQDKRELGVRVFHAFVAPAK